MIFRVYGLVCAVVLLLFILVNFYNFSEGGLRTDLPDEIDPRAVRQRVLENKSGLFSCPAILPYCHSVSLSLCLSAWRYVYLPV